MRRMTYKKRPCVSRGMILLSLLVIRLVILSSAFAKEGVLIRTSITPDEVWVGQKAVLQVDALAGDGWARIKKAGDAKINGAYMLRAETQGVRLSERIHGNTYTGQRYELLVFPQVEGKIAVPSFPVDIEVKTWGANPVNKVSRLSTQGVELNVRIPPGAEGIRGLISTTGLAAGQRWEPDTGPEKVGDAIRRIITFKAEDISGMAFTPIEFQEIEGVGVYPGEPEVSDKKGRGTLSGQRVEKVTYVFEKPGKFHLPGIVFYWWDIENGELKRIELAGKKFEIAAVPVREALQSPKKMPLWLVAIGAGVSALLTILICHGRLQSWLRMRRENEAAFFRRVIKAVHSGNAVATLRETMRWLDKINTGAGPGRLDLFLSEHGGGTLKKISVQWVDDMENNVPIQDASALAYSLKKARRHWKKSLKNEKQAEKVLPALN